MKISKNWLLEWVHVDSTITELCEQFTRSGLEVDGHNTVAAEFSGVVVAKIIAIAPHENAERLQVCTVNAGTQDWQIVCGAKNVAVGIKVPLAIVGAVLPGNLKIKKATLRGVVSQGMICSAKELGLADEANGIMKLPNNAPLGINVHDYLRLDDEVIDLNITPNRGDCFSIIGLARELSVINSVPLKKIAIKPVVATINDSFKINVTASEAVPRYCSRILRGIDINASTPLWLQQKLQRSGMRSVNSVVDVTNYVMLELGQPLHAFDLAKLNQEIIVRYAKNNETMTLIDETKIALRSDTLVIADVDAPVAVAGIMGGMHSAVSNTTQDILLESAFFVPLAIMGKARRYGLHTDASHRFERGVDPSITITAMQRATQLLIDVCGGKAGPISENVSEQHLPARKIIALRQQQITRILGWEIDAAKVTDVLRHLEMQVHESATGWQVQPPAHRFDINLEVDLIEEIARIVGLEHIPSVAPIEALVMQPQIEAKRSEDFIRQIMVDHGFHETLTYSFVDPKMQRLLLPEQQTIALQNPIANDNSVMRTSIWVNLIPAVVYNQQHQQARVRLFEIGRVYQKTKIDKEIQQPYKIAAVMAGTRFPEQWGMTAETLDFYDVKAEVKALVLHANFIAAEHPSLHPGQSAQVYVGKQHLGWLGMLHPTIMQALKLTSPVGLFELDLTKILWRPVPKYQQITKFPAIRRDLAIVVAEEVTLQQVYDIIRNSTGKLLLAVTPFDIYRGQGVAPGYKSLALALTFQHPQRTLTDAEVIPLMEMLGRALQKTVGAKLRE